MAFHPKHLCKNCGIKYEDHGCDKYPDKCPAITFWGKMKPFPNWPISTKDQIKAGELFDKRIDRWWASSNTTFSPIS